MAVKTTQFTVNGQTVQVSVEPDTPLLYVLRNQLGLKGSKFGCGDGLCGACMVHIEGRKAFSCDTPIDSITGKTITTVEALVDPKTLDPLVEHFEAAHAYQCGYCTSGMLMAARALLNDNPAPSRDEILTALNRNLCRCGVHMRVVTAIQSAARASVK